MELYNGNFAPKELVAEAQCTASFVLGRCSRSFFVTTKLHRPLFWSVHATHFVSGDTPCFGSV